MMNIFFKYFAKRIIVEVYPSRFIFKRTDKDTSLSVDTYVCLDNSGEKSALVAIGEEIPKDLLTPDIHKIDLFINNPLPPKTTVSRDELIQFFFEFNIGRCFSENRYFPIVRPVLFILGADRLSLQFQNPKNELKRITKLAGASEVIFDTTEE